MDETTEQARSKSLCLTAHAGVGIGGCLIAYNLARHHDVCRWPDGLQRPVSAPLLTG